MRERTFVGWLRFLAELKSYYNAKYVQVERELLHDAEINDSHKYLNQPVKIKIQYIGTPDQITFWDNLERITR